MRTRKIANIWIASIEIQGQLEVFEGKTFGEVTAKAIAAMTVEE